MPDSVRPFNELIDSGVLWLVNASALHPRGIALALHTDDEGEVIGWSLQSTPDGSPFVFPDGAQIVERKMAVERLIAYTIAGGE